jgi:signal transduction histidine kinase
MVLGGEPPAATTLVSETRAALSDALERTRHLMFELRPQRFDRHGLDDAITALCEQVGVEAGFEVVIDIPDTRYEGVIEDLCYRTVREAVINARKHSGADHLWVTLTSSGGSVHGVVRDDGKGFDPHSRDRAFMRLHMGIDAMAERIRLAGGTCEITSEPGAGCLVSFSVPVPEVSAERWDGVV